MTTALEVEYREGLCASLLEADEIRQCFAEEICIKGDLNRLYDFDFLKFEIEQLPDWFSKRSKLIVEAEEIFAQRYPGFIGTPHEEPRRELFMASIRKLDSSLTETESFSACEFLGNDPYYLERIEGLKNRIRMGSIASAEYSDDIEHIDLLQRLLREKPDILELIQRKIVPFFQPASLDIPEHWASSMQWRDVAMEFQGFERLNPLPGYINTDMNFPLCMAPRNCRMRAAARFLIDAGLPDGLLRMFGISLYETDAMVRYFKFKESEISEIRANDQKLMEFIAVSAYWKKRSSPDA